MRRNILKYKTLILSLFFAVLITCLAVFAYETLEFLSVTGPCNLEFPRDHGPHPGYRTEWWYYTGNLTSENGNRYGFQLTFFRSQISPPGSEKNWPQPPSAWRTQQIYLGHAAISDISGKHHLQAECVSREALDMAGSDRNEGKTAIFIRDWSLHIGSNHHVIKVTTDEFAFELSLTPVKQPVLHGDAGYSRKGSTPERASCYYSFTRLNTKGILSKEGKTELVEGVSWMDHEFSTAVLEAGLAGWDWFSLQLSDKTEVMCFLLRKDDGGLSPVSSGTFVDAFGATRHLANDDFKLEVLETWKSPTSNAVYPAKWRLLIFPLSIQLTIVPNLADQEMQTLKSTGVTYWEGSVSLKGTKEGFAIIGQGYVELTGYAGSFDAPM
jgi:predicted secreted hydrolase